MSDSLGAQPGGPLLALPSEVRLLIYEMIFPPSMIGLCTTVPRFRRGQNRNLALLATCRTIYAEAKPVFYENAEFHAWWCYNFRSDPADDEGSLLGDSQLSAYNDFQVKPQIRKLALAIKLTGASKWASSKDKVRWYRRLTSELTLLSEAPHLKKVHIELSTTDGPGIAVEYDQVISLLGRVLYRVLPTISICPGFQTVDFEPLTYFQSLAKLNWVDTTHEVYSKSLAHMENCVPSTMRKLQDKSAWVVAKSVEHHDIVNNENFRVESSALWQQSFSTTDEIERGLYAISDLKSSLGRLKEDIAAKKIDLAWIVEARSDYTEAKAAGTEEAPIVVD